MHVPFYLKIYILPSLFPISAPDPEQTAGKTLSIRFPDRMVASAKNKKHSDISDHELTRRTLYKARNSRNYHAIQMCSKYGPKQSVDASTDRQKTQIVVVYHECHRSW
jgi:hypothetical protein